MKTAERIYLSLFNFNSEKKITFGVYVSIVWFVASASLANTWLHFRYRYLFSKFEIHSVPNLMRIGVQSSKFIFYITEVNTEFLLRYLI